MTVPTSAPLSAAAPVAILCSDGSTAAVDEESLNASKLVQSLKMDLSEYTPTPLAVPFCRREIEAYFNHSDSWSLSDCVAALKVSDFLQDDSRAAHAAEKGSTLLVRCSRVLKKRKILQPTVEPTSEDIEAFLSLEPPLAERIMSAGGCLLTWLKILPRSCFHVAVAAEVNDHSFELTCANSKYMRDIAGGLKSLSPPLKSLKALKVAPKVLQQVAAPLNQLVSLDIDQCPYPSIPTTLTALTRLRLVSAEKQSFAVFTSDLSSLAQLRHLELDSLYTPEYEDTLREHLSHLTGLTHLSISFLCMNLLAATALRNALYACTSLEHLSLENDSGCSCVHQGRAACTCAKCPNRVLWALPGLTQLTYLRLSCFHVEPADAAVVLSKLPHLLHLDTHNMFNWGKHNAEHSMQLLVSAISQMKGLQALNASGMHLSTAKTADLLRMLPKSSLTSLDLQGNCLPSDTGVCIAAFSELRDLLFTGCLIPNDTCGHFSSLVYLTRLSVLGGQMDDQNVLSLLRKIPRSILDLNIAGNEFPVHAAAPVGCLTAVKRLALGFGDCATDNLVHALAEHIPSLRNLCSLQLHFAWYSASTTPRAALYSSIMSLPHLPFATRLASISPSD